jgi:CRP-like cAMP-binding protein
MERISLQSTSQRLAASQGVMAQRKKRMQAEEARYTMVLHSARKALDISIAEYCLADSIHKLSGSRSPVPGWCYASKEQLGKTLGFSRQSIHSMINKLKKQGLIELQEETGYLRSTDLWRDTVEILKTRVFGE